MFMLSHLILTKIVHDIKIITSIKDFNEFFLHYYILNFLSWNSFAMLIILLFNYAIAVFSDPGYVPQNLVSCLFRICIYDVYNIFF